MDHRTRVQDAMAAMSQGQVAPLLALMADDVGWRWMGVGQWSRTFEGKPAIVDTQLVTETFGADDGTTS
jgi:ketosteroid isomerase-like protein